jgi:SAM-dependent methyltransferase
MPAHYDEAFYASIEASAQTAAREIVPLILEDLRPTSVIDVGCGEGSWLAEFLRLGVENVQGVDGPSALSERLKIPTERFRVADLERGLEISGKYDIALCLEVAEHLSPDAGARLLDALCGCTSYVVFSAAVPMQGGSHHVNEQWLDYWIERFEKRGFEAIDSFRPRIVFNLNISWWYRQNLVLFVEAGRAPDVRARLGIPSQSVVRQEWVHAETVGRMLTVSGLIRSMPRALARSASSRLSRLASAALARPSAANERADRR